MFGLSIFDTIKVSLIAVLVIFCTWLYFDRKSDKAMIAEQQIEIANQKIKLGVVAAKQKTMEAVMKKTNIIKVQVQKDADKVDPVISGSDGTAVIQLFDGFRVQPDNKVQPPAPGRRGGAKALPGLQAHP